MAPSAPTAQELAQQKVRLDRRTQTQREAYMKQMDSGTKCSERVQDVEAQLQKLGNSQVNAAKRTQLQQKLGEEKSTAEVLLKTVNRYDKVLNRTVKDKQAYVKYLQDTRMLVKKMHLPPEIAEMICVYEYRKRFSWDDDE